MDPYTLAYLAAYSDFFTTRRYIYPQAEQVRRHEKCANSTKGAHFTAPRRGPLNSIAAIRLLSTRTD
jgi:hypothetical protein